MDGDMGDCQKDELDEFANDDEIFKPRKKKSLRIQDLALAKADVCYSKVFGKWNASIFYGWISLQKYKKRLQVDGKGSLHHG